MTKLNQPLSAGRRRNLLALAVAAIVAVNLVVLGVFLLRGRTVTNADLLALPATPTAEPQLDPTPTPPPNTPEPTTAPTPLPDTPVPEPTATVAEPTPSAEPVINEEELSYPPIDTLPPRAAFYRHPHLILQGPIQDDATIDAIVERAGRIVGADNVDNGYVIHPDAEEFRSVDVIVESPVLFDTGKAEIRDQFTDILELGIAIMVTFPEVDLVIEGHTDSEGSDRLNQRLSEERATAIRDYIADGAGVTFDRFEAVGFGAADPLETNDTELGRALNRRIELQILNLLASGE